MTADYTQDALDAKQDIEDAGREIIIRNFSPVVYDVDTDTETGGIASDQTCFALETAYKQNEIDGTIIQVGDKRFLIASASLTVLPKTSDILIDGNDQYKIQSVSQVNPGNVPILYKLQVRK